MKKTTTIITAAVLTLGVAGGAAAFGKHRFGDPDKRANHMVNYIADELELDATQEQALNALKDQMMQTRTTMKSNWAETPAELEALFKAETFDQARALELVNAKTSAINAAAPENIAALGNFLDSLNPEQKAEVLEFIENRRGHRGKFGRH
ncbi:MAG: Spy/CpxP family protein refolding chaperone [Gammaproteobacteria bacterium]|nr:Spy/CpxP family protein refolding chaperone [Gammaproteobacteria bacterium]